MSKVSVLNIRLHGELIAKLTDIGHDRSLFAFNESYIAASNRAVLGLRFKDAFGELITDFKPTQTSLMPYFSNLLPEGHLRDYLSRCAGVKPVREFFLLKALGKDLAGAVTVLSAEDELRSANQDYRIEEDDKEAQGYSNALHFSLAGVQLKFSAISEASGGLTIPVKGMGGSWIVKLPSVQFAAVPENEYSMMMLAKLMGMDVPEIKLVDIGSIDNLPEGIGNYQGQQAFAIKRFDRDENGNAIHIEDFAQVFDVYPRDKYSKASSANIAQVIGVETQSKDVAEFIRRLTFNVLIGNADMHLKNWSLIYPDKHNARLAPAYDFVSTIAYIPDQKAALKFSRSKRFDAFGRDELSHLAAKAQLPERLVLDTARETIALFHQHWQKEKANLPLAADAIAGIERHLQTANFISLSI
jgi:serine/threonine-protein kinase HipA